MKASLYLGVKSCQSFRAHFISTQEDQILQFSSSLTVPLLKIKDIEEGDLVLDFLVRHAVRQNEWMNYLPEKENVQAILWYAFFGRKGWKCNWETNWRQKLKKIFIQNTEIRLKLPFPASHLPLRWIDCNTLAIFFFNLTLYNGLCPSFFTPKWLLKAKASWTEGRFNNLQERLQWLFIAVSSHERSIYLEVSCQMLCKQSPKQKCLPTAQSVRRYIKW